MLSPLAMSICIDIYISQVYTYVNVKIYAYLIIFLTIYTCIHIVETIFMYKLDTHLVSIKFCIYIIYVHILYIDIVKRIV